MPELQTETVIRYPRGTRVSSLKMVYDCEDLEPGLIGFAVGKAVNAFMREHEPLPVEDMFITIGFSTAEVLVEVSDRLTR